MGATPITETSKKHTRLREQLEEAVLQQLKKRSLELLARGLQ